MKRKRAQASDGGWLTSTLNGESPTTVTDDRPLRRRHSTVESSVHTALAACPTFASKNTKNHPVIHLHNAARVEFWTKQHTWPGKEHEIAMNRRQDLINDAHARPRALSRKRSNASLQSESASTQITGVLSRDQKCAPYKHPLFERQLKESGSYMTADSIGISEGSKELCRRLLQSPQTMPQNTLFSSIDSFDKICQRMQGENEAKIMHVISPFVIPSAEALAIQGAQHLNTVRETVNTRWTNAQPFMQSGPQPQPDFTLGYDIDAFNKEQLRKLQPFLGDLLHDTSLFAATWQLYFPFLTGEVKCGGAGLDVADRQNAYAQSVILRGLYTLFRLVGREAELNGNINGFSVSHNDTHVRIWGHYIVVNGDQYSIRRHLITNFSFTPSEDADQRWKAWSIITNIYDLWLPDHFRKICSAIDMLQVNSALQSPQRSEGVVTDAELGLPYSEPP